MFRRKARGEAGFTLVELLVVITILGILASIVVFAVSGLGDKGQTASIAADASTLRTAEEAYFAKFGVYGTPQQLKDAGFITDLPTLNSIVLADDFSSFQIGSTGFTPTGGPTFLAASNTVPPFSFMASSFIRSHSTFNFFFGASGALNTRAKLPSSPTNHDVLFASADRANAETVATAVGVGSAVPYTQGQLAILSCKSGSFTLPVGGAPSSCAPSSRLGTALANSTCNPAGRAANALTPADVVNLLGDDCRSTGSQIRLSIADPGAATCGSTGATAPYGCAAQQALVASGISQSTFNAWHSDGRIVYATNANVTAALTVLRSGNADIGFTPASYVQSPGGPDTNNWRLVSSSLHTPILQYAVVLNHGTAAEQTLAQQFLDYVRSAQGQGVLKGFGYLPIS